MAGTITAFVGGNGDGKTLGAMALHVSPAIAKNRTVAATFNIIDPDTGLPHANSIKITEWRQLMELRNCLLVLDEINAEFPSRGAMSLPADLLRLIHQMRKPKVDVVWTAVNWARADVALREATQRVTVCNSYLPDKWQRAHGVATLRQPSGNRHLDANNKPIRLDDEWPPKRLFRYRTYNANAFDDFTVHTMTKLRPIKTNWYWRPWHDDHYAYDTSETVPLMDNVSDAGICIHCGGSRTRAKCTCPRPVRLAAPDAPAPEQDDSEEHDDE